MEGLVCGRYRITGRLCDGGMAEVWVAKHELIEQYAAVKLLLPRLSVHQQMVKRLLQEAKAAAAINDPGIVQILDVGFTADGRAYIVMELLQGETLAQRLARVGRLSVDEASRLLRQLAGVMQAAHAKNIVHRDLKPDNLFLTADPEVTGGERIRVLDFGLAKLAMTVPGSVVTEKGALFGTPTYMAPEQCLDTGAVDERADLYAMGCVFYRCLCGRPPFDHPDVLALLHAHLSRTPARPSMLRNDIPASLDTLIMRLLAKQPDQRVQSCQELLDALRLESCERAPGPSSHDSSEPDLGEVVTEQLRTLVDPVEDSADETTLLNIAVPSNGAFGLQPAMACEPGGQGWSHSRPSSISGSTGELFQDSGRSASSMAMGPRARNRLVWGLGAIAVVGLIIGYLVDREPGELARGSAGRHAANTPSMNADGSDRAAPGDIRDVAAEPRLPGTDAEQWFHGTLSALVAAFGDTPTKPETKPETLAHVLRCRVLEATAFLWGHASTARWPPACQRAGPRSAQP